MLTLSLPDLYMSSASLTDELLSVLAASDRAMAEQRPCPRVWSAEEYARHALYLEDVLLRVEGLGLDPYVFPDGFAMLPGQVLESHFPIHTTQSTATDLHKAVKQALDQMTPELLAQTIEDSGERTVAQNAMRYLELSAAARASARLVLRIVSA